MKQTPHQNEPVNTKIRPAGTDNTTARANQLPLDFGHTPSLAEADFVVSQSNQLAFDHIIAFPNWTAPLTLLSGPVKSGKSHLARIWVQRAEAIIAREDDLENLARDAGLQPVLLEDVDRQNYPETALFHLLNQCMRDTRPLLMTAEKPVSQWQYRTADVLSRARLAAHFQVAAPDDIQLSHMLVKLLDDRQVGVDAKVISYLVARMERSTEEAVALVALMDEMALARRTPITRSIAGEALTLRANRAGLVRGEDKEDE